MPNKSLSKNHIERIKVAFTLTEVVVATFISGIILSFIFIFLWDISNWISETKKWVVSMSHLYDFSYKLNNYRNVYITWWILVDNTSTWSDVFLMRNLAWDGWVLMWVVKLSNNKLDTDNTTYEDRWIWFRKLTASELATVDSNVNNIYSYIFQEDQIFSEIKVQDLILVAYNWWKIFDLSLIYNSDFQNSLIWQFWADLPRDSLKRFNIDF